VVFCTVVGVNGRKREDQVRIFAESVVRKQKTGNSVGLTSFHQMTYKCRKEAELILPRGSLSID
jgi:hypothetical protein